MVEVFSCIDLGFSSDTVGFSMQNSFDFFHIPEFYQAYGPALAQFNQQVGTSNSFDTSSLQRAVGDISQQYGGSMYTSSHATQEAPPTYGVASSSWGNLDSDRFGYGSSSMRQQPSEDQPLGLFEDLSRIFHEPPLRVVHPQPLARLSSKAQSKSTAQAYRGGHACPVHGNVAPKPEDSIAVLSSEARVYQPELLKIKGVKPEIVEAWKEVTTNVILLKDKHPMVREAMKNLFILYAGSRTFRFLVEYLRKLGPITVRSCQKGDPKIPTALYSIEARTVLLNPSGISSNGRALGCLAFELSNAELEWDLREISCPSYAGGVSAKEFGRTCEMIEMKTLKRMQQYHQEAGALLKKFNLADPVDWHLRRPVLIHPKVQQVLSRVGIQGKLKPDFKEDERSFKWLQASGHTAMYEDWHRSRFPQRNFY